MVELSINNVPFKACLKIILFRTSFTILSFGSIVIMVSETFAISYSVDALTPFLEISLKI